MYVCICMYMYILYCATSIPGDNIHKRYGQGSFGSRLSSCRKIVRNELNKM